MQCLKALFQAEAGRYGGNRLNFGGKRKRAMFTIRNQRFRQGNIMKHPWLVIVGTALPTLLVGQTARSPEAQTERGSYARIAIMRVLDAHAQARAR
jgi:hypothetical protein